MRIPKGLSVTHLVTIPADLTVLVEMSAAVSPLSVNFLRFTTGQQNAGIIGDFNDLQELSRLKHEMRSLGTTGRSFEWTIRVARHSLQDILPESYYSVNGKMRRISR